MPSKTTTISKGNTTRVNVNTGAERGAGKSTRFYVGRNGNFQYKSYFKFDDLTSTDSWWSGVGRIVSATLTVTVDNGYGPEGDTLGSSGSPKVRLVRLADSFGEGGNAADFDADDWTEAAPAAEPRKTYEPTRALSETVVLDVTDFVEYWAPTKVRRRDNGTGRAKTNHGFGLFGTTDPKDNWAIFSEDETSIVANRPVLTLNYTYAATAPSAPANLSPSGAVASVASFQGDFADADTTDELRQSQVQVYTSGAVKSGTATASNDRILVTAHPFEVGSEVWFHSLTGGAGLSTTRPYWVKSVSTNYFTVTASKTGSTLGATANITTNYSALTVAHPIYSKTLDEGAAAIVNSRFVHVPDDMPTLARNTNYKWRCRVYDQEGSVSAFTSLTTFSVTNAAPDAPTLTSPGTGASYANMSNATFAGTFSDDDVGDTLLAYQVQLSAYPEDDAHWLDDEFILWNTGKVYGVGALPGGFTTPYGGGSLDTGTYHWRARVWDNHHGVSAWSYDTLDVTADFVAEPNDAVNSIQLKPRAPWRIVIKDIYQSDGVTRTTGRGPGRTVAILEDAKNVGASLMYNSPGEAHWTLAVDHPSLSVIEPKQTHYSIQFRQGDGWREVFAGLVWNVDATDRDIVFYGLDYLALLDRVVDTRYKPTNAEADFSKGGSKYSSDTIRTVIIDQLTQAKNKTNSPVGFIGLNTGDGSIDALNDVVTVYSTYQPVLNFITGLLESHKAGKALNTRIHVKQTTSGGYQWFIDDSPGTLRENLRMRYGELVQGYRIMPFGDDWATRVDAIGRDKDGLKVRYSSQRAPGIDEATWGRWDFPTFIDGISDGADLARRGKQLAVSISMLGRKLGLGLRSGVLQPRDGYDLMDRFPVDIEHGSIDTSQFGHDGEWVVMGITWQALQRGDLNTTLTLLPKESGTSPSADLLVSQPISSQAEWQVGWAAPNPLAATARYWLDQSTGAVYERASGAIIATGATGTAS